MRAAVLLAGLLIVPSAAAALPRAGVVVPGASLGGLELGATRAGVRASWGPRFGSCRGCALPTWYFTYRKFEPEGAGVSFRQGRAAALFTHWSPDGWRTSTGVRIGDSTVRLAALHRPLLRTSCGVYEALTLARGRAVTAFYVVRGKIWGFGLLRAGTRVCR